MLPSPEHFEAIFAPFACRTCCSISVDCYDVTRRGHFDDVGVLSPLYLGYVTLLRFASSLIPKPHDTGVTASVDLDEGWGLGEGGGLRQCLEVRGMIIERSPLKSGVSIFVIG